MIRKNNNKLTSGLSFLHISHSVVDAGVIFTPFSDQLAPRIIVFSPLSKFGFRDNKLFPESRGGSSTKPGGIVIA